MKKFLLPLLALAFALAGLAACSSDDGEDTEAFSVKFSLASVPENLTLDSLEISIALGDTGSPQKLTIDLVTGTSKAQVSAFPGQKFELSYTLYASGYDIGRGQDTGTLAKDMKIEIKPTWNQSKIESARNARSSGKLLPVHLGSSFGQALAGKPVEFTVDSAAGHVYTWYIRVGDSLVASGTGTKVSYTPPDSLGGKTINIKLVVKKGNQVVEERAWDVAVLASLPKVRLAGVVTKTDTSSPYGTYTRFKYNGEGRYDSVLYYDTTAYVSGRAPVAGVGYTYTQAHHPAGDPSKAVRWTQGDGDIDSVFSYDSKGRLASITVTQKSSTTVDSLFYPTDKSMVIRSLAQGKVMRVVRHTSASETAEVDSIYSQGDSGLVLSGLIKYELAGGKVVNSRVYRKFDVLAPYTSEWTLFNALGTIAFRKSFEEGAAPVLVKTETYAYKSTGVLERVLTVDEESGEVVRAEYPAYENVPAAKLGAPAAFVKASAAQVVNLRRIQLLADVGRHFPYSSAALHR